MDERGWERLAAWSGLVFFAVGAVAFTLTGQPPTLDDSTTAIRDFLLDKRAAVLTQALLFAVATAFFVWWLGVLRTTLRRAEGGAGRLSALGFGGGLILAAMLWIGVAMYGPLTTIAKGSNNDDLLRTVWHTSNLVFTMVGAPSAVAIGAFSLVVLRTGALAKWTAWLGGLAVAANLVGLSGLYYESGFYAPGGDFSSIVFGVTFLWILATSVVLIQKLGKPRTA